MNTDQFYSLALKVRSSAVDMTGLKEKAREILRDPWKVAAIGLGVAFLVTLVVLLTSRTGDEVSAGAPTTTAENGETPDTTVPGETTPTTEYIAAPGFRGVAAVKVDNAGPARPQVGLANLPLLVELPVEGGMTRFTAVVDSSATGTVGPVRSLRPVDADLFPLLAPTLVSSGGQSFVLREVDAGGTFRVEPGVLEVFASLGRTPPYNMLLDLDALFFTIDDFTPFDPVFPEGEIPSGNAADSIELPWNDTSLRYEDGAYRRYQSGEPFEVLDRPDGDLVTLVHDTVVVLMVAQRSAGYTDGAGAEVPTFDVIGSGDLLVFNEGEAIEGSWLRRSHSESYQLYDSDGQTFGLPAGRIYVALVPWGALVDY